MKSPKIVAVLLLQAALMGTPGSQADTSLDAARQLFLGGKLKEAAEMYTTLTVTQPKLELAHVRLIRTRIAGNDLAGATQAARLAFGELPNSASVWAAAGDLQFRFSKFSLAASIYRQALQLDPIGRATLIDEIHAAGPELSVYIAAVYIAAEMRALLDNPDFREALPGFHLPDAASQRGFPIVLEPLNKLAVLYS